MMSKRDITNLRLFYNVMQSYFPLLICDMIYLPRYVAAVLSNVTVTVSLETLSLMFLAHNDNL